MLWFWILVFILSLAVLVKSADWVVEGAEKIALAFRLSPFIVGVVLVALGTSLPEVVATLIATLKGNTAFVVDTAFGSNIATVLLIVGITAVVSRKLVVTRSLIDLDAPLLAVSTVLIGFMVLDSQVTFSEGLLLIIGFLIYLFYSFFQRRTPKQDEKTLPSRAERRQSKNKRLDAKTIILLVLGIAGLIIGSNYIVESVSKLSLLLGISASFITISAVAVGTSLPELVVSVKAAAKKKYELALGNIFGSNVFTIFLVIGLPALIKPLSVNPTTLKIGLPYLIVATLLFIISGISRKIHIWEGLMYLLIYILFIIQFFANY
jgi:cation:H+ antiporter